MCLYSHWTCTREVFSQIPVDSRNPTSIGHFWQTLPKGFQNLSAEICLDCRKQSKNYSADKFAIIYMVEMFGNIFGRCLEYVWNIPEIFFGRFLGEAVLFVFVCVTLVFSLFVRIWHYLSLFFSASTTSASIVSVKNKSVSACSAAANAQAVLPKKDGKNNIYIYI